jgi:hypothetical protein
MARLRDMGFDLYRYTEDQLRAKIAPGGDHHHYVVEGGAWWVHTKWVIEMREAWLEGDLERLKGGCRRG